MIDGEQKYNLEIANQEQKDKIKLIEKFNIGATQKAELILVLLDVKPTTELMVYKWNDAPTVIAEGLRAANLEFVEKLIDDEDKDKIMAIFAVAKNIENARKLIALSAKKDHKEYGALMGYPTSAVESFLNGQTSTENNQHIFSMALSADKEKQRVELELLTYWENLVKKYSPRLFEELSGKKINE